MAAPFFCPKKYTVDIWNVKRGLLLFHFNIHFLMWDNLFVYLFIYLFIYFGGGEFREVFSFKVVQTILVDFKTNI